MGFHIVTESSCESAGRKRICGRYIFEEKADAEEFVRERRKKTAKKGTDMYYSIVSQEEKG